MATLNTVSFIGNVSSDLQVVEFEKGDKKGKIINFQLAVKKNRFTNDAMFLKCVSKSHNVDFIENNVKKGTGLIITGELNINNYEKDGKKNLQPEILITTIDFLPMQKLQLDKSEIEKMSKSEIINKLNELNVFRKEVEK